MAIDRIVGFEELGGKDNFAPAALMSRLKKQGGNKSWGYYFCHYYSEMRIITVMCVMVVFFGVVVLFLLFLFFLLVLEIEQVDMNVISIGDFSSFCLLSYQHQVPDSPTYSWLNMFMNTQINGHKCLCPYTCVPIDTYYITIVYTHMYIFICT